MRDYLNSNEKNQFMVLSSILQNIEGIRNEGTDGPKIVHMLEAWKARDNMTKDEHRSLKMAETYLRKFVNSVFDRQSSKEQETIVKKLRKYDFRLVDDYTMQQIHRDMKDKLKHAVVPREQFYNWCRDIMDSKCNGCEKDWNTCDLHQVFEENFIPESGWCLKNCKFAYKK